MQFLKKKNDACVSKTLTTNTNKMKQTYLSAISVFAMGMSPVMASSVATDTVMSTTFGVIFEFMVYIGLGIAILGVVHLLMAWKGDRPEKQHEGFIEAIVGGALTGIGFFVEPILSLFGISL